MKKIDSNDLEPVSSFEKLPLKHKAESMPVEPISSIKKI